MIPTPLSYLGIPGYIIFWLLFAIALGLASEWIYRLVRFMLKGQKESRFDHLAQRVGYALAMVLGQRCTLKSFAARDWAGVGHFILFWGFVVFLINYLVFVFVGAGLGLSQVIESQRVAGYFRQVVDIAALLVLVALLWALGRKYIARPPRLSLEPKAELTGMLVFIVLLMLLHFSLEGLRLAAGESLIPTPLLGAVWAGFFAGLSPAAIQSWYISLWWVQFLLIVAFIGHIRFSPYLHIMFAPFNILFRSLKPRGALVPLNLEAMENFGVDKVEKFTWKQLMDGYACAHCGRCQANCPAWLSGKPLNPKEVVLNIKENLIEVGPALLKGTLKDEQRTDLISKVITEEVIWECTTCRACQEECPALIEHIQKIVDMRRHLVLERVQVPATAANALKSLEARGHPWRGTAATRLDWAQGLGVKSVSEDKNVDLLLWVGCTPALEELNMKVVAALTKLLQQVGINFGILGSEEACCGEPARRLGNEYLFQMLAQKNIDILRGYGVKRILTLCPHCYSTIKDEYPQFGGDFEVIHHTQLLARLLAQGRLKLAGGVGGRVVYHDSCYLGRYNNIYEPPRKLLRALPGLELVEMRRRRQKGFCCGAGGGRLWQEETIGKRISHLRTEEARATGASIIASACPYCLQMFQDGIKALGVEESLKAMDVAEVVAAWAKAEGKAKV